MTVIPTIGVWVSSPARAWAPPSLGPAAPWPPSASHALMVIGHQAWQRTEMEARGPRPPPRQVFINSQVASPPFSCIICFFNVLRISPREAAREGWHLFKTQLAASCAARHSA